MESKATSDSSPKQLSIMMMAMANRLFQMGGTIGADEHGFRNMGDQLAGWAEDVRRVGVGWAQDRQRLAQLAISMMAEARQLNTSLLGVLGQTALADRLAGLARSTQEAIREG